MQQSGLLLRLAAARRNCYAVPFLGYVAQLAPTLPMIFCFELSAILKAWGLGGSSVSWETEYALPGLIGFTSTRPSVYVESCMLEEPLKTFVVFYVMHAPLSDNAGESSGLRLTLLK